MNQSNKQEFECRYRELKTSIKGFDQQCTNQNLSDDNLKLYKQFLQDQRIEAKDVIFPTSFAPFGYQGVSSDKLIKPDDIIISIPDSATISAFKAIQDEKCYRLIKEHDEIFVDVENEFCSPYSDFMTILLYVVVQRIDKNSKWKSMLDVTPNPQSLIDCPNDILGSEKCLQYLCKVTQEFQLSVEAQANQIADILQMKDIPLVKWAYKYVMSRRLSISNQYNYTFLIPLLDMVNHGEDRVRFTIINWEYEKNPPSFYERQIPKQKDDFQNDSKPSRQEIDFESQCNLYLNQGRYFYIVQKIEFLSIEQNLGFKQEIHEPIYENRVTRKILQKYVSIINMKILELDDERQIWNLHLFDDEDDEDESQYSEMYENQESQSRIKSSVDDKYLQDYYNDMDNEQDNDQPQATKPILASNYEWYSKQSLSNDTSNVIFAVQATEHILPGFQLLNLYGRLGNEKLLLHYGFCLLSNKFDRVIFRIQMNSQCENEFQNQLESWIVPSYVSNREKGTKLINESIPLESVTQEFKLQKSKICLPLINFLRTYSEFLRTGRFNFIFHFIFNIRASEQITKPSLALEEIKVMQLYQRILTYHLALYQSEGDEPIRIIEQSLKQNDYSWKYKLSIYKLAKIRILKSQEEMIETILRILHHNIKSPSPEFYKQTYVEQSFKTLIKIKDYLKDFNMYAI